MSDREDRSVLHNYHLDMYYTLNMLYPDKGYRNRFDKSHYNNSHLVHNYLHIFQVVESDMDHRRVYRLYLFHKHHNLVQTHIDLYKMEVPDHYNNRMNRFHILHNFPH